MQYTTENNNRINENLYNANVQLVDKNRELSYDIKEEKKIRQKAIAYIVNKSKEYKPGYRKVELNFKECSELLNILESEVCEW